MVTCAKCGFLTYKDHSTKMLEEASLEARRNGHFPTDGPIIPSPRCFVLTFDLPLEVSELAKQASDQEEKGPAIFLKVIQKERSCPTFCQWHHGSSPKEHREMLLHIECKSCTTTNGKPTFCASKNSERRTSRAKNNDSAMPSDNAKKTWNGKPSRIAKPRSGGGVKPSQNNTHLS